jgi:hypothetical protein
MRLVDDVEAIANQAEELGAALTGPVGSDQRRGCSRKEVPMARELRPICEA